LRSFARLPAVRGLLVDEPMKKLWYLVTIVLFVACVAETQPGGPNDPNDPNDPSDPNDPNDPSCPSTVIDAPTTSACAASTLTCLEACGDASPESCYENCITADANAEACGGCLEDAFLACANAAGCQAAFDAQECCAESCADPDSDECYTVTCAAETAAYDACVETKDCDDAVCFAQ
jgi:hypothetical protein